MREEPAATIDHEFYHAQRMTTGKITIGNTTFTYDELQTSFYSDSDALNEQQITYLNVISALVCNHLAEIEASDYSASTPQVGDMKLAFQIHIEESTSIVYEMESEYGRLITADSTNPGNLLFAKIRTALDPLYMQHRRDIEQSLP